MLGLSRTPPKNASLRTVRHVLRTSLSVGRRISNRTVSRSVSWITGKNEPFRRDLSTSGHEPSGSSHIPGTDNHGLPLLRRMIAAWTNTPTKWYPLPIAVGALLLVAIQYRKNVAKAEREVSANADGRDVIKLKGPWQVHVIGALPLRNASRLWGYLNSFELPVWFRPIGFRIYGTIFGCNFDEMDPPDLKNYVSLGDLFYRKLRPGVRPVDDAILVSPADGKVLHFGTIQNMRVEQVKGISYSLDALLGVETNSPSKNVTVVRPVLNSDHSVVDHHEFGNVNGIEYSLDQLLGSTSEPSSGSGTPTTESLPSAEPSSSGPFKHGKSVDASVEQEGTTQESLARDTTVAMEMGVRSTLDSGKASRAHQVRDGNELFFAVVYLAPGDYHRFHSPTAWVVEKRRHFVGELYSVSPYMAKRLENLFVLNERVALLGRWKHGFFSMVPVGATNVGSIIINFDQDLRTNIRGKRPPPGAYTEAVYSEASSVLRGQPLLKAQEMGGFKLGSTIVLVFEAPADFEFSVKAGQLIKVGEKFGDFVKA